jgi:hypothetical protein
VCVCARATSVTLLIHTDEQSEQVWGINLVVIWHVFRESFRMLWTGPNYIPIMVASSKIVTFLFFGGMFLHSIHLSSVFLRDGCHKHFASSAKVTPLFTHHQKYCVHLVFCAPWATFNFMTDTLPFFPS